MNETLLFRTQVLNWEYLLSIPSLLVRLPVTVANVDDEEGGKAVVDSGSEEDSESGRVVGRW